MMSEAAERLCFYARVAEAVEEFPAWLREVYRDRARLLAAFIIAGRY